MNIGDGAVMLPKFHPDQFVFVMEPVSETLLRAMLQINNVQPTDTSAAPVRTYATKSHHKRQAWMQGGRQRREAKRR